MDGVEAILRDFGLSSRAAQVYLAGLALGPCSVRDIARQGGLSRTGLYDVMRELQSRQLVVLAYEGKKVRYSMVHPRRLLRMNEMRIEKFRRAISKMAIAKQQPLPSRVRTLTGREGFLSFMDELEQSNDPYVHVGDIEQIFRVFGSSALERSILKRDQQHTRRRIIAPRDPWLKRFLRLHPNARREVRFLPAGAKIPARIYCFAGHRVATVSFSEPITIVIIEDQAVYDAQMRLFNALWAHAAQHD